jgi:sugar-specific transcriptional regulator TrmB
MIHRDLHKIISAAGLDGAAADLYLAGLEMGSAPASAYAEKTGGNRITTYNHLEELTTRSIFTAVKRERATWYSPVPPEHLAVEARKNAEALERALPELRSLRGVAHRKPHVRFFEGWEGVQRVYQDTLTAGTEILNFANSAIVREYWQNYDEEYVAERVRRGIHLRGIAPDDAVGRVVHGQDRAALREIRLVPAKDFDFNNEINIYDHKIAITSFSEKPEDFFGIIIESKEVADTQRQIFEMAWRYAATLSLNGTTKKKARKV